MKKAYVGNASMYIYIIKYVKIKKRCKKSFSNERVRGIRFLKICHKIISILITNLTIYHN